MIPLICCGSSPKNVRTWHADTAYRFHEHELIMIPLHLWQCYRAGTSKSSQHSPCRAPGETNRHNDCCQVVLKMCVLRFVTFKTAIIEYAESDLGCAPTRRQRRPAATSVVISACSLKTTTESYLGQMNRSKRIVWSLNLLGTSGKQVMFL